MKPGEVRLFKTDQHGRRHAGTEDHGCFGEVERFGMFGHRLFVGQEQIQQAR